MGCRKRGPPTRARHPRRRTAAEGGPEPGSGDAEYPYLDIQDNWALTSIDLSSLEYVEGTILFWYNPEVTSLRFPALYEVGHDLEILENDLLNDLRAPLLESVGERGSGNLAVFLNPDLTKAGKRMPLYRSIRYSPEFVEQLLGIR